MNSPLTEHSRPEKALWYQEVLSLDPASRIFLPYARLLTETGRRMEAVEVLRSGLSRHPEFLDARLFLIELLHEAGQDVAAGLEASGVIESLSRCSALWEIWSKLPGVRADQAAMLLFFGATFRESGPSLADVFAAGMKALRENNHQDAKDEPPSPAESADETRTPADSERDKPSPNDADKKDASGSCFVMNADAPWYSLDAVPDDDDVFDDEEPTPSPATHLPPSASELFFPETDAASPGDESREETDAERVPAVRAVPRAPLEGKSSLCTRSMARILEEQGATGEAANIYRELLEVSSSPEERAELNAKLDSLMTGTENAAPEQPADSGLLDMLETLAVRLENKSRA